MSVKASDVSQRSVSAMKWEALLTVARYLVQLGSQIVLARLLGPDAYGVIGMGLVVMFFAAFVTEFGFSMNLVQRADLDDEDIRLVNTWQWLQGLVVALALWGLAPQVALYFGEPRVERVVRWLALVGWLAAVAGTPSALLARHMNFRTRGLIDVLSYALGYVVVGLPMAWLGHGVDALLAAWVVQALAKWIAMSWVQPYPKRFQIWSPRARRLLSVGLTAFCTNIVNWTLSNIDRVLIGRILSAHAVGVYTAAHNLANTPSSLLLGSLQGVLLSATARMQDERGRMRDAYVQVVSVVLILLLPLFVWGAMFAPEVVGLLYGDRWHGAGPVTAVLMVGMPFYVLWGVSTPVLWNTGRAHQEALFQAPLLVAGVTALWLASGLGLVVMAIVATLVYVTRGMVISGAACRSLEIPVRIMMGICLRTLALVAGVVLWVAPALAFLRETFGSTLLTLILGLAWSALLVPMVWWWGPRRVVGDAVLQVVSRVASRRRSAA